MAIGNNPSVKDDVDKTISVFFGKDGYYFIIKNAGTHELMTRENVILDSNLPLHRAFEKTLIQHEELYGHFSEIKIVLDTDKFTFVPVEFFSSAFATSYYKFNLGEPDADAGVFYYTPDDELYVIFAYNKQMINTLENIFTNAVILPDIAYFLEDILENQQHNNAVYANLTANTITIAVFRSKKLMMANKYHFVTHKDAEYYILKAYYNYDLDNEYVPLFLKSDIQLPDIETLISNIVLNHEDNQRIL